MTDSTVRNGETIFYLQFALQMANRLCDDIAATNIFVVLCKLLPVSQEQMKKSEKLLIDII